MLKRTILAAIVTSLCLLSVPASAKWTKWYNLNSRSDMRALVAVLEGGTNRYVYKRVQCKQQKSTIMIRIDYRSIFEGGFYKLEIGFWKNIKAEVERQKKRGVTIISRSDVETNRGLFTCLVWRQAGWG